MRQLRTLAAGMFAAAGFFALTAEAQAAACANFTGFYVGANVGGGSYDTTWTDHDGWSDQFNTDTGLTNSVKQEEGVIAGAQVGFNQQSGCALFGIEADWSWTDLEANNTYTAGGDPTVFVVTQVDELEWFGTVRGRAGVVVDQLLLYGTGGVAFAAIEHAWTAADNSPATETYGTDDTRWGWTVGGGGQWQLSNQLSVKGEVLYASFGTESTTVASPAAGFDVRFDNQDSVWIGRVGVNYGFSM